MVDRADELVRGDISSLLRLLLSPAVVAVAQLGKVLVQHL